MAEILVAMHAPDGVCVVDLATGSSRVKFHDFRLVGGDPLKWTRVELFENKIEAENHDASQHLWIAFILDEGIFGDGGGQVTEQISGNACSMWCSVNGGSHIGISTNQGPRQAEAYTWFTLAAKNYPRMHKK